MNSFVAGFIAGALVALIIVMLVLVGEVEKKINSVSKHKNSDKLRRD